MYTNKKSNIIHKIVPKLKIPHTKLQSNLAHYLYIKNDYWLKTNIRTWTIYLYILSWSITNFINNGFLFPHNQGQYPIMWQYIASSSSDPPVQQLIVCTLGNSLITITNQNCERVHDTVAQYQYGGIVAVHTVFPDMAPCPYYTICDTDDWNKVTNNININ